MITVKLCDKDCGKRAMRAVTDPFLGMEFYFCTKHAEEKISSILRPRSDGWIDLEIGKYLKVSPHGAFYVDAPYPPSQALWSMPLEEAAARGLVRIESVAS